MYDPVLQAIKDGKTYIGNGEFKKQPLSHKMLGFFNRNHIIEKVKAPLMQAIILAAKLSPKPTRDNTYLHNSHVLDDIFERVLKRFEDPRLSELFESARIILVNEIEHDIVYAYILNVFAEEIAKEIEKGNWLLNKGSCPQPGVFKKEEE